MPGEDGVSGGDGMAGSDVPNLGEDQPAKGPEQNKAPFLENLHKFVRQYRAARGVDGDDLRFISEAFESDYFTFANLSEVLLSVCVFATRPFRQSLQRLLDIFRYADVKGCQSDTADMPVYFINRMQLRLPLLPVSSRTVKDKAGNDTQAMDIPCILLLQRILDCPRVMEKISSDSGGHVMSARERRRNGVPDRHLTPVPTRRADGARKAS